MSMPVGPYTPVVRAGPFVVCSGQVGLAIGGSAPALVDGGPRAADPPGDGERRFGTCRVGPRVAGRVQDDRLPRRTSAQYSAFNAIYMEELGSHRPARTLVAVTALPVGAVVEVEAWALARP